MGGGMHMGGVVAGVDIGGALKYERGLKTEMTYATTITGSTALRGRNYGKANYASWTLMENPEAKTGVPVAMQTAILLNRRDEGNFQFVVSIKAKADWRTSMEWLVGTTQPNDPVLFDPTLDPTSDKYSEYEMKLAELDLEPISDFTFVNIVEGVVKTRKIGGELLNAG